MKIWKKILQGIAALLGLVILAAAGLIGYLTATEYRPEETEPVEVLSAGDQTLSPGSQLTVLTFNTGYGGLGQAQDFFMDGGEMVRPKRADVEVNLAGIQSALQEQAADVYFLQETDRCSKRSYKIDETAMFRDALGMSSAFGCNYRCTYVPYPLPTIGKVESGLLTLTNFSVSDASRAALPVPFSWPLRIANLKRCLLVERIPIADSGRELVLVNLHLEAYDDGEGKAAQTKKLAEFLSSEYEKGNYVIAGGDFNQTFPNVLEKYPITQTENWEPGVLDAEAFSGFATLAYDDSTPTCRLLDAPYQPGTTQVYGIDGFIVTANVSVEAVETIDLGFQYSDHNPVKLTVSLSDAES